MCISTFLSFFFSVNCFFSQMYPWGQTLQQRFATVITWIKSIKRALHHIVLLDLPSKTGSNFTVSLGKYYSSFIEGQKPIFLRVKFLLWSKSGFPRSYFWNNVHVHIWLWARWALQNRKGDTNSEFLPWQRLITVSSKPHSRNWLSLSWFSRSCHLEPGAECLKGRQQPVSQMIRVIICRAVWQQLQQ